MLETIAIFLLVVITWINWSRYYVQKQIRKSLSDVGVGNPVRSHIQFKHFVKYFKIKNTQEGEVLVFEYGDKKIHIGQDGNETVLYIKEETQES